MKKFFKELWKDESGQGMTEYLLLMVAIVALVMMFGDNIKGVVTDKITGLTDSIGNFTGE